jgi:hypothetical protein
MTKLILSALTQERLANGRVPPTHIPRKGLVRGLTLAALAALGTMTCVASPAAATAIDSCKTLDTFGATYVLTNDLTICGTCLVVAADRITIDLAGHAISWSCGDAKQVRLAEPDAAVGGEVIAGVTDGGTPDTRWQGTTVKNGTITGFEIGVSLGSSARNVIDNLQVFSNAVHGLLLGPYSLVKGKDCLIADNGDGIHIGDFGQVQDCTIIGSVAPGGNGIVGGSNLLITRNLVFGNQSGIVVGDFSAVLYNTSSFNTVIGVLATNRGLIKGNTTNDNGDAGIATGEFSTVSYNTSNRNRGGGVLAGNRSLVTGNETKENGNAGIATVGLNTVSYNTSNGNEGGGINVGADGLFDGTRSLVTGNTTNNNVGVGVEAWCPSTVTNNNSSGNGLLEANYLLKKYGLNGLACYDKNNK